MSYDIGLKRVEITSKSAQLIQTHNAVNIPLSNNNQSAMQSAVGFDSLRLGIKNDASHARRAEIAWYADQAGVNFVGNESIIATATQLGGIGQVSRKADWFKVTLYNEDAALAHIMSSWTTLIP